MMTPQQLEEIVKRLKEELEKSSGKSYTVSLTPVEEDVIKAQLEAAWNAVDDVRTELTDKVFQQEDEIARLRAALEQIADTAPPIDMCISIARAALSSEPGAAAEELLCGCGDGPTDGFKCVNCAHVMATRIESLKADLQRAREEADMLAAHIEYHVEPGCCSECRQLVEEHAKRRGGR